MSEAPPAEPVEELDCPNKLPTGASDPKPLPNVALLLLAVEEKLKEAAEPKPEDEAASWLLDGAAKENDAAAGAPEPNPDEEEVAPNPVGTEVALPKPGVDVGAAEEPNPPAEAKLNVLA